MFIQDICFKLMDKCYCRMFKQINKSEKCNYIIREGSSIYITVFNKKDNTTKLRDITEEIGSGPLADEFLDLIEKNIVKTGVKIKYRCTKCKTTLVDNEEELEAYGGLGCWCKNCIEASEQTNE